MVVVRTRPLLGAWSVTPRGGDEERERLDIGWRGRLVFCYKCFLGSINNGSDSSRLEFIGACAAIWKLADLRRWALIYTSILSESGLSGSDVKRIDTRTGRRTDVYRSAGNILQRW